MQLEFFKILTQQRNNKKRKQEQNETHKNKNNDKEKYQQKCIQLICKQN